MQFASTIEMRPLQFFILICLRCKFAARRDPIHYCQATHTNNNTLCSYSNTFFCQNFHSYARETDSRSTTEEISPSFVGSEIS
jgi:hypothetical protein